MDNIRSKDRKATEKTHQLEDSGLKEKYGAIEHCENGTVIQCNGNDDASQVGFFSILLLNIERYF